MDAPPRLVDDLAVLAEWTEAGEPVLDELAAAAKADPVEFRLKLLTASTTDDSGFKRARAEFSDLLYQAERMQGVPNRANQAIVPEGAYVDILTSFQCF